MLIFISSVIFLIVGYLLYGLLVEKVFGADADKKMPAKRVNDGIDYVELPSYKAFLIQFLNIAGLGPVFGALMGALYGPAALLWIVFGSIFAGAVHDYIAGRISLHFRGQSLTFLVEKFFGRHAKRFFIAFITFFLLLVGAVFASSPARLLAAVTNGGYVWWISAVFVYYFIATLLPVDKIIGRVYPLFAFLLLSTTFALCVCMLIRGTDLYPELTLHNIHPKQLPMFPLMFVTIACGAISGFHSTQSPMVARCLKSEKTARAVFYGSMITEGFIALVWATLGMSFYGSVQGLLDAGALTNTGNVVKEIATSYLGHVGGVLTVLSVVVLSITSGDTAFRSARLNIADVLRIAQKKILNRVYICVPIFAVGIALCCFEIGTVWRYFGWGNQVLATVTLWICSLYLKHFHRWYFITLLPAIFMTVVCSTYIFQDKIGFSLPMDYSVGLGILTAVICTAVFFLKKDRLRLPRMTVRRGK